MKRDRIAPHSAGRLPAIDGPTSFAGAGLLAFAAALALSFALFAMASGSAAAAPGHSVLRTISTGPGSNPRSIALDSSGNAYVLGVDSRRIEKYDASGSPVPFGGTAPYLDGNAIYAPAGAPFRFKFAGFLSSGLAVDTSGGPNDGYIYVAEEREESGARLLVFDADGIFKGELGGPRVSACSVAVNPATGDVFVGSNFPEGVYRYSPPGNDPSSALPTGVLEVSSCGIAADSAGAVYAGGEPTRKFTASQFGVPSPTPATVFEPGGGVPAVDHANGDLFIDRNNQIVQHNAAGALQGAPFGAFGESRGAAVDSAGNILASDSGGGIFVFGPTEVALPLATTAEALNVGPSTAEAHGSVDPDGAGQITACEFRFGEDAGLTGGSVPCSPAAPLSSPTAVTATLPLPVSGVTYHYRLFVTNANGTQVGSNVTFNSPAATEGVTTGPATAVKKDSADLNGSFTGDGQATNYYFEWGKTTAYGATTPAPPGNSAGSGTELQNVAPVSLSGLQADSTYHYRLVVSSPDGVTRGQDETFTTANPVTNLSTDPPTGMTNQSAELHGSFDGDGRETSYYFEWGASAQYGKTAPAPPGNPTPPASGRVVVPPVTITGLQEGATYHYRIVATNSLGTTYGPDAVVRTAEPPTVGGLTTRKVTATSAELVGEVNPRSGDTHYHFEWGPTNAYGNTIPVPDVDVGSGETAVSVNAAIAGLTPGVTYHFRLVATNQYGTSRSEDQGFSFYPTNCPNSQLRQETRSNALPDCRAYELVSPSFAQGALLFPLNSPVSPVATSPARVGYAAAYGTFPEEAGDPGNLFPDLYISTRSDVGWYQKYIGRPANETLEMGGPPKNWIRQYTQSQEPSSSQFGAQVNPDMSVAINYDLGFPGGLGQLADPSNSPFVWDTATGKQLDRWPTNVDQTAGGFDFVGEPRASEDFSHFVFSSNVVFAPGGEPSQHTILCCWGNPDPGPFPGPPKASVYDNDLQTGSVVLASRKGDPAETPFQGYVLNVSHDGARILMSEDTNIVSDTISGPTRRLSREFVAPLYLRVDASHTYEIAAGHKVQYVGSTSDGKTIYLASNEQLTADDKDSSRDLFVWKEASPNALTLVSVGTSGGNSDDCSATWTAGCGIGVIEFIGYSENDAGQGGNGATDSAIASDRGDLYFLSPEQLAGAKGNPGDQNLYLYRDGSVRFVAGLEDKKACTHIEFQGDWCSDGAVARMQVTPDGSQMALVTNSHLTGYDSGNHTQMFTFDPRTSAITCVSCRRDGGPPLGEVFASQNGLFQAYDGRVFFSTEDPLVPADTNENEDVYEYTEGRAQLISSGLGAGTEAFGFMGQLTGPGLISVSANGTDVYFGTYDVLVSQDHNGRQLKVYDARANGGFPAEREEPRCAAADECHGPGSSAPVLPPDRTSANLGKPPKAKAKVKKKQKKKHKKKSRKQGKSGKAQGKKAKADKKKAAGGNRGPGGSHRG